jgi:hypothetical protein
MTALSAGASKDVVNLILAKGADTNAHMKVCLASYITKICTLPSVSLPRKLYAFSIFRLN